MKWSVQYYGCAVSTDFVFVSQVSVLVSVLVLATVTADREQDEMQRTGRREGRVRRWEVKGMGIGEEDMEVVQGDGSSLESTLCLVLDHFTYLQGTQGNQKKVCVW